MTAVLVIGTYTEHLPHVAGHAPGLFGATYDSRTAQVHDLTLLAATPNPSYAAVAPDARTVYCINETASFDGEPGGGITAFERIQHTGALRRLNSRPSAGVAPCHVAVHPDGRSLAVANYISGTAAVVALEADGRLGSLLHRVQLSGRGPDPVRQDAPHAHMACFDPVTGRLLVTDLGTDRLLAFDASRRAGSTLVPVARFDTQPGAGPRHVAFHPSGEHVFLVNELASTVVSLRRQGNRLLEHGSASTLPEGFTGNNLASAVRVATSGQFVFVANRGHDSIAVLSFDPADGRLDAVGTYPTAGRGPRDFCQTPDEACLIVANLDSDSLAVLDIDESAGTLSTRYVTGVPSPASVTFVHG